MNEDSILLNGTPIANRREQGGFMEVRQNQKMLKI
jgi:hypothetical protein